MKHILPSRDIPMLAEAREKKRGFVPILEVLIFLAVFTVASTVQSIPTYIVLTGHLLTDRAFLSSAGALLQEGRIVEYFSAVSEIAVQYLNNLPVWVRVMNLILTAVTTIVCILFCRVLQKRRPSSMGLSMKRILPEYLKGAGFGILMIAATVLLSLLSGAVRLSYSGFRIGYVLLFLIGYMVQGMSEEVMCRGYLMVSITRRNQVWRAVLVSSLVFSLLHIMNPGFGILPFINIFLTGVVFGVYALKRNDLWGACAMHSFWNFFQGHIFGISVSGTGARDGASILNASAQPTSTLLTGGSFGIEGSISCTIVIVVSLLLVLFVMKPVETGAAPQACAAEAERTAQD